MEDYKPDIETQKYQASRVGEEVSKDWSDLRNSYIKDHKTELLDDDMTMFPRPRSGCGYCYGTGVEGKYDATSTKSPNQLMLCRCITNKMFNKINMADTNRMTYGEYREMIRKANIRFGIKDETTNTKESTNEQNNQSDIVAIQGDNQENNIKYNEREATGNN
jgi:hypothetical protein